MAVTSADFQSSGIDPLRLSILHSIICEFFPSQAVTQWAHLVTDSVSSVKSKETVGNSWTVLLLLSYFGSKIWSQSLNEIHIYRLLPKSATRNEKKKKKKKRKVELETRLATLSFWLQMLMQNTKRTQQYTLIRVNVKLVTCGGWPSQQSQTRNRNWCALLVSYHRHFHSERFASVGSVPKSSALEPV